MKTQITLALITVAFAVGVLSAVILPQLLGEPISQISIGPAVIDIPDPGRFQSPEQQPPTVPDRSERFVQESASPTPRSNEVQPPNVIAPPVTPTATIPPVTFHKISIAEIANSALGDSMSDVRDGNQVVFDGIPFELTFRYFATQNYSLDSSDMFEEMLSPLGIGDAFKDFPTSGMLQVDIPNPITIEILLVCFGCKLEHGDLKVGHVRLGFQSGNEVYIDLVVGKNIRNRFFHENYKIWMDVTYGDETSQVWAEKRHSFMTGYSTWVVDKLSFDIPESQNRDTLTEIEIVDTSIQTIQDRDVNAGIFIYAITVKSQ